ncbi:MAG: hypothetical protein FWH21_07060, partial [Kiritimatiellaeota bacterium]|nr:hypothetical protein [Kiritimatiellota bacterium]
PAGAGMIGGTVRRFRSRLGCAPRTSLHRRLLTSRTSGADRFLIIDDTVYHIGASFKDLGKKRFAFSKLEIKTSDILKGA